MHTHRELLLRCSVDMLRAMRHVADELHVQLHDPTVVHIGPARVVLTKLQAELLRSARILDEHLVREFRDERSSAVEGGISHFSEFLAHLYAHLGPRAPSDMVRDDCIAAHFICTSLSSLCAISSAFDDNETGNIASSTMASIAPILIEIERVIPQVVISELSQSGYRVNLNAVRTSLIELEAAWENVPDRIQSIPHFLQPRLQTQEEGLSLGEESNDEAIGR